jgi:SpoVK/Ycf46/Vps4 family AAA+-type ATPase
VIAEVQRFWTLKEKFQEYGFSHKRGFMLHGPPGSGKTSTISIIVNDMVKRDGIVILANDPGSLAHMLSAFRQVEPERQLVVIWEDLDSVIDQYGESHVLSILDGECQIENVVFIATTNYPEKLDARIVNRPSRFDKIVKIGMPNADARRIYLQNKLPTESLDQVEFLVKETEGLSIAHLREIIVAIYCQGSEVAETLSRLKRMKYTPKSDEGGGKMGLI